MKILDLFCGAGGFSLGFKDANNKLLGVDKWDVATNTYSTNIGESITTDVLKFDPSTIGKIDILIGSPPCQDFSTANSKRTRNTKLVEKFLEIKDYLNPRWWVMEEVPGVGKIGEEKGWFRARYLQANWFGLPHERKRLFAGNYPGVSLSGSVDVQVATPIAQIRGYGHGKEHRQQIMKFYIKYRTEKGMQTPLDSTFEEIITVPLYAEIMGFPADYVFTGTKKEQYMQIGNAVCPPISRAIYNSIKKIPSGGLFR